MPATTADDDCACGLFEQIGSVWPRRFAGFVFGENACSSELRRSPSAAGTARCFRERHIYFTATVNEVIPFRSASISRPVAFFSRWGAAQRTFRVADDLR